MILNIDPTVDCVFKAILGAEENKNILIHFLNSVLTDHEIPITSVDILNPYNEREFQEDKLTVVDIKARDANGSIYQIEVQVALHSAFTERMLYLWSRVYQDQMQKGDDFENLNPVVSIWLLKDDLFPDTQHHHHFEAMDQKSGLALSHHFGIHALELKKWHQLKNLEALDIWLKFFNDAENMDLEHLPKELDIPEIQQAMQVLKRFTELEKDRDLYQRRQEAIMELRTRERSRARAIKQLEAALAEKEAEREAKEVAQAREEAERQAKEVAQAREEAALNEVKDKDREIELLKAALKNAGLDNLD